MLTAGGEFCGSSLVVRQAQTPDPSEVCSIRLTIPSQAFKTLEAIIILRPGLQCVSG